MISGRSVLLIGGAAVAVVAGVAITHAVADLISYGAIAYVVYTGYGKLREGHEAKLSAERDRTAAVQVCLDQAKQVMRNHGLYPEFEKLQQHEAPVQDVEAKRSFLSRARGN